MAACEAGLATQRRILLSRRSSHTTVRDYYLYILANHSRMLYVRCFGPSGPEPAPHHKYRVAI